jgi:hypothetical protein
MRPPAGSVSSAAAPWAPTTGTPPPEMAARIATAIEQRLRVVLEVAEQALEAHPNRSTQQVF